jgi:hypothetical protein
MYHLSNAGDDEMNTPANGGPDRCSHHYDTTIVTPRQSKNVMYQHLGRIMRHNGIAENNDG